MFKKAERKKAKLRLALTGPSGSGKTYSALLMAKGIGGPIAVIDTEHGSASLYSDVADFDVMELQPPYSPERYIEAIKGAEEAGYNVLIIDSMTHEWNGEGGTLELVDQIAKAKFKGNSYAAWGEMTPRHNKFINAILQSRLHIISTMRSKQDFVLVEQNGKQSPKKVGMAPIQREGLEYEFTAVLDLSIESNLATASKDRTRLFVGDPLKISEDTGQKLLDWLETGVDAKQELEQMIADHTEVMEAAATEEDLKTAFAAAYEFAKARQDRLLADSFKKTYDACKAALQKQEAA